MALSKLDWNYLFIAFLGGFFFLPFLGGVHLFDWDEINFAECSREMLLRGEYLRPHINFMPFWEKPPLFMWFQSVSMYLFGVNEYAARFPNAACGILTLLIIYHIGKKRYDKTFGWLWFMAYGGSILPHLYFRSGIIDPFFNLFIFLSLIFLIEGSSPNQTSPVRNLIIGGIFSGFAILTKGPVGLLLVGLTWFFKLLIFKELRFRNWIHIFIFSFVALLITSLWFGVETAKNGTWFVKTFIEYTIRLARTEDAGHGGFVGYHFVVLFLGCFPASIFALRSLYFRKNFGTENIDFSRWMKTLFWVVLIVFSLVQSKIVHYSSMCYLPLTFLSALTLKVLVAEDKVPKYLKIIILSIGIFIGLLIAALPFVGQNIALLKPLFQKDIFALKNLDAAIIWHWWESMVGLGFVIALILVYFKFEKRFILRGTVLLFTATAVFLNAILIVFINKIEGISQNAAIEFYESKINEDCYIQTHGFKSYAHLFYSQKRVPTNPNHNEGNWLKYGNVDKPTYFVTKFNSKPELDTVQTLRYLYDKNGFVFYQRK
ncbi:MAG: glycosyltransferase family 39 protein [Saprospiraceae bacterium]|nr:glycosyltransferase family 39 protein [Saprospiraceae bacterium]